MKNVIMKIWLAIFFIVYRTQRAPYPVHKLISLYKGTGEPPSPHLTPPSAPSQAFYSLQVLSIHPPHLYQLLLLSCQGYQPVHRHHGSQDRYRLREYFPLRFMPPLPLLLYPTPDPSRHARIEAHKDAGDRPPSHT